MANMWKLSVGGIKELMDDPEYGVSWETVTCKGAMPNNISHHKPCVFGHSVVVFGGINDYDNAKDAFEFDSNKNLWTKLKQTGDVPSPRDDHSLSQIDDSSFLIFGGFVKGWRVNECYVAKKNGSTLEWSLIKCSGEQPCIRASQSASVHNGKVYIFGGQDDDNNKLNDLWELDLSTSVWKQIKLPDSSYQPIGRSGHSSNIFGGKMYIFGGILELTKELNELIAYDFAAGSFELVAGDSQVDEAAG